MAENKIVYNIDVESNDAVSSLNELNDAFNATQANADGTASSMSRLSSAQGTLGSTSDGLAANTINTTREFNNNEDATKDLTTSYKDMIGASEELTMEFLQSAEGAKAVSSAMDKNEKVVKKAKATKTKATEVVKKDTEATKINTEEVTKNGGAIAVLDQFTGGLASQFKNAYEASRLFNISLKGMRKALIASGIGILVVALGAIVLYWDEISKHLSRIDQQLKRQNERIEKNRAMLSAELDLLEKQAEYNELIGDEAEDLKKERIAILETLIKENSMYIDNLEIQNESLKTATLELSTREKIVKALMNMNMAGSGDMWYAKKMQDSSDEYRKTQEKILALRGKNLDAASKLYRLENPDKKDPVGGRGVMSALTFDAGGDSPADDAVLEWVQEGAQTFIDTQNMVIDAEVAGMVKAAQANKNRTDSEKTQSELRIETAEKERDAKLATLDSVAMALSGASAIAGRETAAGKALAVAASTISVYTGIASVWKKVASPELATDMSMKIAATAAVAANGFAAVKSILDTKVPGQSGGGGSAMPARPTFNMVGQSVNTTGSQAASTQAQIEAGESAAVRVQVVSSDMTTQQASDTRVQVENTLG